MVAAILGNGDANMRMAFRFATVVMVVVMVACE
jgi:hypothetical protein